jgi:mono/diheme cytochrome c family protein
MNMRGLLEQAVGASGLLVGAALALPVSALGQPLAGDPSSGRQMATTIWASCHQVGGKNGSSGPPSVSGPPSFVDIANMPSTTALSLRVFLRSSHRNMPNLIVSEG